MSTSLFLAVEAAIPAEHIAAKLAVPIGILFFVGGIYLLLWSNYGARKGAAISGVAWFGFSFLLGVFWWFGGPGIPAGLGISHFPEQRNDHYHARWYAFEAGSDRASYFPAVNNIGDFVTVERYVGVEHLDDEARFADPMYAALSGSVSQGVDRMRELFLPIDANNVAQIGGQRRADYQADADEARPSEAAFQGSPFFTVRPASAPRLVDDPATGTLLAVVELQTYANYVDADRVPLEPIPVGEPEAWFAFYDPGATWIPSAVWTGITFLGFLLCLLWLDRMEQREKRLATDKVEEPKDLAVPIAQ